MKLTKVFAKNIKAYNEGRRIIINQGGTSSSKTYSVLQLLFLVISTHKNLIISVVSQTIPHLKLGAIRDFKNIVTDAGLNFEHYFNKSDFTFFFNNSIIEFFSVDNIGKVHGSRRDILFVNECNFVPYEIFEQLEVRTKKTIFLDYNPVAPFWVQYELAESNDNILIKSTYLDNLNNLPPAIVQSIEAKKDKKNWWQVYGLGEIGFSEDLIFQRANLHFYEKSNIDFSQVETVICYVDTADKGEDFFCAVFGAKIKEAVYIFDVIFNQQQLTINEEVLIEKLKQHNVDYCIIESNREGSYFVKKVHEATKKNIIPLFNTQNKEARILVRAGFICDNFYFQDGEKIHFEMLNYLKQLQNYSQTGKNNHDDAPDATAGLAKFCTNYLKM